MRTALLLLTALFAAYAAYAGIKYTRMISNIFMGLVYRPASDTPGPAHGEPVTVMDSSGREIQALRIPGHRDLPVILFCHESGSGKESWEKYASFLTEAGHELISIDLPESDTLSARNSLSQWPHAREVEDVVTVIRWTRKAVREDARIVLFGVSKGADLALAASFVEPSVVGVVADGLFSMKEIFRDYIRKWAPILVKPNLFGEKYPYWIVDLFASLGYWHCQRRSGLRFVDVEALLRKRRVPLLMIHGAEDDYISSGHQRFLSRLDRRKGSVHLVVPQARHNEAVAVDRYRYEETVRQFLVRCGS